MYKKIIYLLSIFSIIFFVTSCESVKRGLSGEKVKSTDEFLIKKKDPLIMPPDYENLLCLQIMKIYQARPKGPLLEKKFQFLKKL